MIDSYRLPTPLTRPHEVSPVRINEDTSVPSHPILRLFGVFGRFMLTNLKLRIGGRLDPDDRAIRLRQAFEQLGGLWIKIGQLLSLRTDVFSEPVCRELARLHYRAQGFPLSEVRAIIEAQGQSMSAIFSHFDDVPLAAASISQVHRAVLRSNGAQVAVKVLRPRAEQAFARDLKLIGRFIGMLEFFKVTPHVHWRHAHWELEQMVIEELDFRYEAANTRRMRKSLRQYGVYVPKVFRDYCSKHVLVTEFIGAVLMSDFIEIGRKDPERLAAWCHENRVAPRKLGRRLFESVMAQMLEDNLFHADLHPGNIMLLRDNRVALIDFGTIGSSEKNFLTTYKASLAALAERDYLRAADLTLTMAITPPRAGQLDALRAEMVRSYRHWEGLTHLDGLGYHERSLAAAGAATGKIMFERQVQMSWQSMRISRTWSTLDAALGFVLPDANYMKLFDGYFRKARARRFSVRKVIENVAGGVVKTVASANVYAEMISPIVRKQVILAPGIVNVSQRIIMVLNTAFRVLFWFLVLGLLAGGGAMLHRFYPDSLWFQSAFLHRWADDHFTSHEMWSAALTGLTALAYTLYRVLKKMRP